MNKRTEVNKGFEILCGISLIEEYVEEAWQTDQKRASLESSEC